MKIGKKLKKNNVAVDIVNFGEEDPSKVRSADNLVWDCNSFYRMLPQDGTFCLEKWAS